MKRRWPIGPWVFACWTTTAPALAEVPTDAASTPSVEWDYLLRIRSETYLGLFQRALLPGPGGAIVEANTVVPVYEYWSLQARSVETPWSADGSDVEIAGWGNLTLGSPALDHHYDGDITSAWVRSRFGNFALKLGRQAVAGGAARYARFDGVSAEVARAGAFGFDAYAGLTVLPRWDGRPGYAHLGSAADSLVYDADALGSPERSGYWVVGARATVHPTSELGFGASFHEQHDDAELGQRNLGFIARVEATDELLITSDSVLDLDSRRLADARARATWDPLDQWSFALEYLHAEPSLFLSRQSVLSVFSTEAFDEAGAEIDYRPFRHLELTGAAYVEWLPEEELGSRTEAAIAADVDRARRLRVRLGYTRVLSADNGYHALRDSLRYRLAPGWVATAEAYFYLYDQNISGYPSSEVYATQLEWLATPSWAVLWGTSLTRSPYASSDTQTLVRLRYDFQSQGSSFRRTRAWSGGAP